MNRLLMTGALSLLLVGGAVRDASAQVYLTPFAGTTFGDDAPATKFNVGAGLTFMGSVAGFEFDFGYSPDFFGEQTDFALIGDSNVTTFSGSLVLAARTVPCGHTALPVWASCGHASATRKIFSTTSPPTTRVQRRRRGDGPNHRQDQFPRGHSILPGPAGQ